MKSLEEINIHNLVDAEDMLALAGKYSIINKLYEVASQEVFAAIENEVMIVGDELISRGVLVGCKAECKYIDEDRELQLKIFWIENKFNAIEKQMTLRSSKITRDMLP